MTSIGGKTRRRSERQSPFRNLQFLFCFARPDHLKQDTGSLEEALRTTECARLQFEASDEGVGRLLTQGMLS